MLHIGTGDGTIHTYEQPKVVVQEEGGVSVWGLDASGKEAKIAFIRQPVFRVDCVHDYAQCQCLVDALEARKPVVVQNAAETAREKLRRRGEQKDKPDEKEKGRERE